MANEKLIYASAARKAILKADPKLAYLIDNIKGVDAVEVVRCKDCKCAKQPRNAMLIGEVVNCGLYDPMPMMRCDDFCSYGERREGE